MKKRELEVFIQY